MLYFSIKIQELIIQKMRKTKYQKRKERYEKNYFRKIVSDHFFNPFIFKKILFMDKKIKIFSGIAASLAFWSIYILYQEGSKPTKRKDILEQIDAIVDEYPEDKEQLIYQEIKNAFIKLIQEAQEEFFDIASIDEELKIDSIIPQETRILNIIVQL
ncbi:hypothetical protein pb186bvf_013547 [Paramecium bursaria]